MPIVPKDFLDQAEDLLRRAVELPETPRREALLRSAVSRAYYAAYHADLISARKRGFAGSIPGYGSHEALWEGWFGQRQDEETAALGYAMKRERVRADYRLRETFSPKGAQIAIADARRLIQRIDAL